MKTSRINLGNKLMFKSHAKASIKMPKENVLIFVLERSWMLQQP